MNIPFKVVESLKIVQFGSRFFFRIGSPAGAAVFTPMVMQALSQRIEELKVLKAKFKSLLPTKPDPLKSLAKFRVFWEQWLTYMGCTYGEPGCPLTYICREHEAVTGDMKTAPFTSWDERAVAITVLAEAHYNVDNIKVY